MRIKNRQVLALRFLRKDRAKVQVLRELGLHRIHLMCQGLIRVPPMLPAAVKETAEFKRIVAMEEHIKKSFYEHQATTTRWPKIEDSAAHRVDG